jgi:hypothetical protein
MNKDVSALYNIYNIENKYKTYGKSYKYITQKKKRRIKYIPLIIFKLKELQKPKCWNY